LILNNESEENPSNPGANSSAVSCLDGGFAWSLVAWGISLICSLIVLIRVIILRSIASFLRFMFLIIDTYCIFERFEDSVAISMFYQ
jgi:hypothetical protein